MRKTNLTAVVLGLSIVACRGGGGGGDDDGTNPDGPPIGGEVTIQQVQDDAMPEGTPVTLKGVVVTAIDTFGSRTGDIWVEEPGGGEFSGVKVFGAPLDIVATLQPGDVVDIGNAEKDEFFITQDTSGRTVTEIKGAGGGAMTMVKVGTGAVPAPVVVDAAVIDALGTAAERDAEWEKYEGVLISVINARQTGAEGTFGGGADDQHAFDASGGLVVESSLASLGTTAVGTCYASIDGIGDYAFDYLLLPRDTADLVGGGTGCTAQQIATIGEVQAGTKTGSVEIDNVFITGISHNKRSFYVATNLVAGPNEGLFAFNTGAVLDASVVIGAKVNVFGTVQEFNDDAMGGSLTELTGPSVVVQADAPGVIVPVANKTAAQLLDPNTAPTFESVLVTLTNVAITAQGDATNGFIATAVQNGTTFKVSTDILQNNEMPIQCYTTITGFWTNLQAGAPAATTKPNAFGFIPASLGATGAGCN